MNINIQDAELVDLWRKSFELLKSGEFIEAITQLKSLAKRDFPAAFAQLGRVYEQGGPDLPVNIKLAIVWYKKAIERADDAAAHLGLARIYLDYPEHDPTHSLARYHIDLALSLNRARITHDSRTVMRKDLPVRCANATWSRPIQLSHETSLAVHA